MCVWPAGVCIGSSIAAYQPGQQCWPVECFSVLLWRVGVLCEKGSMMSFFSASLSSYKSFCFEMFWSNILLVCSLVILTNELCMLQTVCQYQCCSSCRNDEFLKNHLFGKCTQKEVLSASVPWRCGNFLAITLCWKIFSFWLYSRSLI